MVEQVIPFSKRFAKNGNLPTAVGGRMKLRSEFSPLLLWYRQMNIPPEIEHLYRTN